MNAPPAKAGGIGQQLKLAITDEIRRQLGGGQKLIFAFNFEIAIIMALLCYIGFDYIVSHVAAAATKIPSDPQMTPPILTPERLKTVEQFMQAFALQPLRQAADCHLGWNGNEKVDVIPGYVPLRNFHGLGAADFMDQFASGESNISD